MDIEIVFDTENDSFKDNFANEVENVTNQIKKHLINNGNANNFKLSLKDINGNNVGYITARIKNKNSIVDMFAWDDL